MEKHLANQLQDGIKVLEGYVQEKKTIAERIKRIDKQYSETEAELVDLEQADKDSVERKFGVGLQRVWKNRPVLNQKVGWQAEEAVKGSSTANTIAARIGLERLKAETSDRAVCLTEGLKLRKG